jgi:ABC-type transporter Mla subunit MlaD
VNADSVAMLTALSPLGDKYLEITTGSNQALRIPPGATIPSTESVSLDDLAKQARALIPTAQSTLEHVQKDIDELTGSARIVFANVQSITGPQNQRNLTLLLANARELLDKESPQIDRVLQDLDRASSQARVALNQAGDALNQVQTAARTANDTFASANRTIDEIRDPMKTDLAELQRTMTNARQLIADLDTIVSANRDDISDTIANFRAASENLRELTASVKQRPWALMRGKPAADRAVPAVTARQ